MFQWLLSCKIESQNRVLLSERTTSLQPCSSLFLTLSMLHQNYFVLLGIGCLWEFGFLCKNFPYPITLYNNIEIVVSGIVHVCSDKCRI